MDMFFLHQRAMAFTSYEISLILGLYIAPTLGGYIVQEQAWPVVFWWTLAPVGLAIVLVGLFLEPTYFARGDDRTIYPALPQSYVARRVKVLLPGTASIPQPSIRVLVSLFNFPSAKNLTFTAVLTEMANPDIS